MIAKTKTTKNKGKTKYFIRLKLNYSHSITKNKGKTKYFISKTKGKTKYFKQKY